MPAILAAQQPADRYDKKENDVGLSLNIKAAYNN